VSETTTEAAFVVDVQADFTEYRNGSWYDFAMCGGVSQFLNGRATFVGP
jgi:hypothetical protein